MGIFFSSSRMDTNAIATMCRRLATMLQSGIDMRTVWTRELERARGSIAKKHIGRICEGVERGESLTDAVAATGRYFPPMFRELVGISELTGHQAEVFEELADHYETRAALVRQFLGAIIWPALQFFVAVAVVGFLIWVLGAIGQATGATIDILGFGLVGERGLIIYCTGLAVIMTVVTAAYQGIRRGLVWTRPVQALTLHLPILGNAYQTLVLARLAWAMHLTMNAGMPVRRAMQVSLRATGNLRCMDAIEPIDREIEQGNSIHDSFHKAGIFPLAFLDAVGVGEESGRLVESLGLLSRQYHEQARGALVTLTTVASFGVWCSVATVIIILIFRVAMFYFNMLNQAVQGTF